MRTIRNTLQSISSHMSVVQFLQQQKPVSRNALNCNVLVSESQRETTLGFTEDYPEYYSKQSL